ncbi:Calcium-binding component of the spindle pole body (SPB) half-bridge [Rhodotorula kratochvilovae]
MSGLFGTGSSGKKPSPYSSSRHHASSSSARAPPAGPSQLSPDQQQEVREAFELFDLDKDQKLDYHEFKVALRALGFDLKKAEVLKLMRDRNHDDGAGGSLTIGLDGFMSISEQLILARDPLDEIRRAFKLFDEEGTGKISFRNLKKVARELGENLADEELQAMIEEFDLDMDGEISEQEFIKIMSDDV